MYNATMHFISYIFYNLGFIYYCFLELFVVVRDVGGFSTENGQDGWIIRKILLHDLFSCITKFLSSLLYLTHYHSPKRWVLAERFLFKVNNRNSRKRSEIFITSLTSLWWFYRYFWTYVTPFSSVSIVYFEQENVSWIQSGNILNAR